MDPRVEAVLDEWRFRGCDPGYAGLQALVDAEFSGAVTTDGTVGFMVNGRMIGLTGGTIEAFWSSEFSALEADSPALPLLCAMLTSENQQEEGEYYTGETPITDVDETLSSGSFTGFLELSENVFSGDYFVVYYGGTSFSAAILGTDNRIITGQEARDRAADEVGIYTVHSVDIDVVEIPEPEVDESGSVEDDPDPLSNTVDTTGRSDVSDEEPETPAESTTTATPASMEAANEPDTAATPSVSDPDSEDIARLAEAAMQGEASAIAQSRPAENIDGQTDEWLTIPALDPDNTIKDTPSSSDSTQDNSPIENDAAETSQVSSEPPTAEVSEELKATREDLEEAEAALEAAKQENERLRERVEELEAQVAELEAAEEEAGTMSPAEALGGTNLFVRYGTQANFTLEEGAAGSASETEVRDNLQLEWHTTFDDADATVQDVTYAEFLQDSIEYQFSDWLLAKLIFELQEGGSEKAFADLFEAIPEIDRVEFRGEVPVHRRQNGERDSETYDFDLVFRNSMGDPVLVADVHDARSPVDGEAVGQLLADADSIASARQSLAGAFFVTRSYYDPAALETVADATGGSLLRGSSKKSYVRVSRKHGFHLCLIEARDESFHLNVPDD